MRVPAGDIRVRDELGSGSQGSALEVPELEVALGIACITIGATVSYTGGKW